MNLLKPAAQLMVVGLVLVASFATAKTRLPIKTVQFEPLEFNALTGVRISPVPSDEGQQYSYDYRWFLNGMELVVDSGPECAGNLLSRGDLLSVEVTPINAQGERLKSFVSTPVEVKNAPPVILSQPPDRLDGEQFVYQVEANDPDGDDVRFSLEKGPDGMAIGANSGVLDWSCADQPAAVYPVLVVVEDEFGGRAEQGFDLNLSFRKGDGRQ
jgi:hypothetical protein